MRLKQVLFFVAGGVAIAPVVGNALWRRTSAEIERTLTSRSEGAQGEVTPEQLADLPAPVQRYLHRTLRERQPIIRVARLRQSGEFFLNGSWRPMQAQQVFSASPPGFMWDARITAAPFMPVYVRDGYVQGRAMMRASMLGLYPVVNQAGSMALNEGALLRYLGEASWLPTRLLPGDGLSWRAIDDERAEATLEDGGLAVSLEFSFDAAGDLVELYSPGRFREVNGSYVRTPWRVRALQHDVVGGVRMMASSVAEWMLPEGPMPYWRGRIVEVRYTY